AAAPGLAAAAALSAAVLAGRWHLDGLSALADRMGALAVYALALAVWPGLLAVFVYRAVTYTYRLTDRAVVVDRGFRWRPEPPVWLADVAGVSAGAGWVGRRLGVGWVRVAAADGRVLTLTGVADPEGFAAAIREAAERARSGPGTGAPGDVPSSLRDSEPRSGGGQ
ncbi:MAG: PH domain-containing protein, partial [Gemmataceae bacterium]|nr:PH domain-containing protein [Gemmataceae bacterium]